MKVKALLLFEVLKLINLNPWKSHLFLKKMCQPTKRPSQSQLAKSIPKILLDLWEVIFSAPWPVAVFLFVCLREGVKELQISWPTTPSLQEIQRSMASLKCCRKLSVANTPPSKSQFPDGSLQCKMLVRS